MSACEGRGGGGRNGRKRTEEEEEEVEIRQKGRHQNKTLRVARYVHRRRIACFILLMHKFLINISTISFTLSIFGHQLIDTTSIMQT